MTTGDVRLYFISKKAEKKDTQVEIPQLVKTCDNVTLAKVSAINTELKSSCKKQKKNKLTWVRNLKMKLVNMHTDREHRRQLHTCVVNISSTL